MNEIEKIEQFYSDLVPPLYRFVRNIVVNSHDAEDVVADTFVKIIELAYTEKSIPSKAFCFTVARNLAIDFLRRKKKITYNSVFIDELQLSANIDVFEDISLSEDLATIEKHLSEFPELPSNVFYLRYFHDLSFKEISKIMNISENNARIITFRVKKKLRNTFDELRRKTDER